jgi:MOSC domain-containing protein YiiM
MSGKIVACCISLQKGIPKNPVDEITVTEMGLQNDAHAGNWQRQISLLAVESIQKMEKYGIKATAGTFAENITTSRINLLELEIGDRLKLGSDVVLEITQKGKECHTPCEIGKITGNCIMPQEGVFAKVIKTGKIKPGDKIIKL